MTEPLADERSNVEALLETLEQTSSSFGMCFSVGKSRISGTGYECRVYPRQKSKFFSDRNGKIVSKELPTIIRCGHSYEYAIRATMRELERRMNDAG